MFAGRGKIVSHLSCRTIVIFKYLSPDYLNLYKPRPNKTNACVKGNSILPVFTGET